MRSSNPPMRRLLDAWEPPPDAGPAEGVLATTFTLDTALFEEECLARFAGVQSDPMRDGALYRIEREEKLASLRCAAVVGDVHHCAGKRSLRWDLLAARPTTGVMHSKVSLLAWKNHLRAIVASANLTEAGYRSNQECFSTIDFTPEDSDRQLLDPLLQHLREILGVTSGPARARAEAFLDWLDSSLPRGSSTPRGMQRRLVLVSPTSRSVFEQIREFVPSPPGESHVVSPFFDQELRDEGPERGLWGLLRQRGAAAAHFHVAGELSPETKTWRLECPSHLTAVTPRGRFNVESQLHAVPVKDVPTDAGPEARALHAKSLWLEHETWCALMVGSSNFTSAGLGLRAGRAPVNYEANVVYLLRGDPSRSERDALMARQLRGGGPVNTAQNTEFAPAIDADGENEDPPPSLPAFFSEATLSSRGPGGVVLALKFRGAPPTGAWKVCVGPNSLLDADAWSDRRKPEDLEIPLDAAQPLPSSLEVSWGRPPSQAEWPVNAMAAEVLPPPPELQGLSLAALLDLLGSGRPLHEALRSWLRRQVTDDDSDAETAVELIDPHAKVDTSNFLVKRVQRACWAIEELCRRLSEPVSSSTAMAWRLHGPVGAHAVLEAMRKQCDQDMADEWLFLLCELWTGMNGVRASLANRVDAESLGMFDAFLGRVRSLLEDSGNGASKAMAGYISRAFKAKAE